jgi:hypothetical protein
MSDDRITGTIWGFSIGSGLTWAVSGMIEGNTPLAVFGAIMAVLAAWLNYRFAHAKNTARADRPEF